MVDAECWEGPRTLTRRTPRPEHRFLSTMARNVGGSHFCEAGRFAETGPLYSDIKRFLHFVSAWNPSNARWIKMYMKAFGLPGGSGGLREPYQLPPETEMKRFVEGLLALGISEIDEAARAHGLRKAS